MEPQAGIATDRKDSFSIPIELIAIIATCLFLATAAICVRMWSQAVGPRRLRIEDYSLIIAWAGFVAFISVLFHASTTGLGAHVQEVSSRSLRRARMLSNILDIIYTPSILAAKVALLIYIKTAFGTATGKSFIRWAVWILVAFNGLSYTSLLFVHVVACNPRAKIFDSSISGKCVSQDGLNAATGAINLASNLSILLFCGFLSKSLSLSPTRKSGVWGIFVIGILACVAAAGKIYCILGEDYQKGDVTKAFYYLHIWSLAEFVCVTLVSCLPLLPGLISSVKTSKRDRYSYPRTHASWIMPMSTHNSNTKISSKTHINQPMTSQTSIAEERGIEEVIQTSNSTPLPHRPATPLGPMVRPFQTLDRPTSHMSYESYQTASIAGILCEEGPMSPVSETTEFMALPSPHFGQATEMTLTPVYHSNLPVRFANITKTVDVRVSNHTDHGSPIHFHEPQW